MHDELIKLKDQVEDQEDRLNEMEKAFVALIEVNEQIQEELNKIKSATVVGKLEFEDS